MEQPVNPNRNVFAVKNFLKEYLDLRKFRYKSRFICQWDMKKSRPPLSLWRGGLSV